MFKPPMNASQKIHSPTQFRILNLFPKFLSGDRVDASRNPPYHLTNTLNAATAASYAMATCPYFETFSSLALGTHSEEGEPKLVPSRGITSVLSGFNHFAHNKARRRAILPRRNLCLEDSHIWSLKELVGSNVVLVAVFEAFGPAFEISTRSVTFGHYNPFAQLVPTLRLLGRGTEEGGLNECVVLIHGFEWLQRLSGLALATGVFSFLEVNDSTIIMQTPGS
ncbi:hypothetical protein BU15DRAFT_63953 [Melanogaster broomeanus]|nr:hypothetical protein BU15DRAFT_63953 [Melanogaster broomeanus]